MSDDTGKKDDVIGKVQEKVGWLTADREAEAKGKLRQESDGDVTDEDAEQAEKQLREEKYDEYDPAVDDQPVAKDVTPSDADPRTG